MKKATVIVFPGSNCDKEAGDILKKVGFDVSFTWHQESLPQNTQLCFLPGGFSYGDYLRSGAIASQSGIISQIKNFAQNGGIVIGICNGFQILTESKILPGALLPNSNGEFICKKVTLVNSCKSSIFSDNVKSKIEAQIAHADGMFVVDEQTLKTLHEEDRIAFKYQNDVNGSQDLIAGILGGKNKNILGMMPHPERTMVSEDFIPMFKNLHLNA